MNGGTKERLVFAHFLVLSPRRLRYNAFMTGHWSAVSSKSRAGEDAAQGREKCARSRCVKKAIDKGRHRG